jgi:uncharacterized membrane protein
MKRLFTLILLTLTLFGFSTLPIRADEITPAQTVQAGLMAQYSLEIHNETGDSHTYRLAIGGLPDSLAVTFTQGGPVLDSVTIPANSYGQVTLRVEVPADTPVGHYAAHFTATRDDGVALISPLTLNVENTYAVKIVSQNINVTTFSGQEFTFEATAANSGAAPVTHLALQVDTPAKWVTRVDPPIVAQLEPGASATYNVHVLVPTSQIPIDQPVPLKLTSDQVSSPVSTLTVRVQKSPHYLLAAGAVIILAVAGVFAYIRTKGRR